jgi:hypothetical protein
VSDTADFKAKFQRLLELREARDIDKAKSKKSEAEYREAEAELFAELEEAGIRGRLEFDFGGDLGVAKFQRRSTIYGRIVNKQAALESLKAMGLDDVIYEEAVREGRLNEKVREWLETKAEIPEGIDYYPREGISISRK